MEKKVLAAIVHSRKAHDKIKPHIKDSDFSDQGNLILKHVESYYDNDPEAQSVDKDLLIARIERELVNPKHGELFKTVINSLPTDISAANVAADFVQMRKTKLGERLGTALVSHHKQDDIDKLLSEYLSLQEADLDEDNTDEYQNYNIKELVQSSFSGDNLVPIFPGSLNRRIDGGLTRGSHVVVFGRPNSGKSLFMINLASCYIRRGYKVLYIINEDPTPQILLRIVGNLSKMTKYEIIDDPDKAQQIADQSGYQNLIIRGLAPGTFKEINSLVEEHKPDILIIDQLRNVYTHAENRTNQLEKAATEARNIAKRHDIIVYSVTQAGDSATNKLVLDMGDIDGSNTGIPGQADLMIGVGSNDDFERTGQRMLTMAKNKVNALHEHFPVQVIPNLSKIVSLD